MHRCIDTSTSFFMTGIPPGEKLFKLKYGAYSNRIIAIYPETQSIIKYSYSDPPYSIWSNPETITSSSANQPVTATIDDDGNLYFVFTSSGSNDLKFVKLTFNAGSWTAGSVNTICNVDYNYCPSIVRNPNGELWVGWCYCDSSFNYTIRVKKSANDGLTWGIGSSDIGTALSTPSIYLGYVSLAMTATDLHAAYYANQTALYYRNYPLTGGSWSDEEIIYVMDNLSNDFSIASSPDNKIAIALVVRSGIPGVVLKENDGLGWSGPYRADFNEDYSPIVKYLGGKPYLFHVVSYGENQKAIKFSYLSEGVFTTPEYFIEGMRPFEKVFLYDDDASTKFYDRTDEAESPDITADVYHPTSNALIDANNDVLYLGMEKPFYFFHSLLSTTGSGGVVQYSYWNGSVWEDFIPYSGTFN
ncbi:MAG: hypothetical protein GY855_16530, partial [candidate division Zixibacteria bacterium]|nr:hypothetical protein [candidate division Zixibacteria bacterium]